VDSVLEGLALRIPKSVGSGVVVQVRSISDGQRLRNSRYYTDFIIFPRNNMWLRIQRICAAQDISCTVISRLESFGSSRVVCTMLPIQEGLQKLPAIELTNQQDGRVLDTVDVECFVKQKCCIIVCT